MGNNFERNRTGKIGSKKRRRYRRFWGKLCIEFYTTMLSYARRLVNGNQDRAEVLVQTTVSRALTYCPKPTEIKDHKGYLLRTVRNEWIRGRSKVEEVGIDELPETTRTDSPFADQARTLREIEARVSIQALVRKTGINPAEFERMLDLYARGLSFKEMAVALSQSVEQTKVRWYRCVSQLRNQLLEENKKALAARKSHKEARSQASNVVRRIR